MKCKICGNEINVNCDWNQGRCPHRPADDWSLVLWLLACAMFGLIAAFLTK